jgi:hypothetical protein
MWIDERAKWEAFQASPWKPPASLEAALSRVQGPRVWLSQAVDFMAFGDEGAPTDREDQTKKRGYIMEVAARRCQASRALCQAAQKGALSIMGSDDRNSDASEKIPSEYFDTPRRLGNEDNSLETDPDRIPEGNSIRARRGHTKRFNVRVETAALVAWLRSFLPTFVSKSEEPATPQEPILSGRGKTARLIESTFKELYPTGRLPDGVSSEKRNETIREDIRARYGNHLVPSPRTIQKTLKKMREHG